MMCCNLQLSETRREPCLLLLPCLQCLRDEIVRQPKLLGCTGGHTPVVGGLVFCLCCNTSSTTAVLHCRACSP
jgi:hypothetical protein